MDERTQRYLDDRRFWAFYLGDGSGQVNDPPSFDEVPGAFGQLWNEYLDWWGEQRGSFADEPLVIEIANNNGVVLEAHFGEELDFFIGLEGDRSLFANVGGHWQLPGLRWEEFLAIGGLSSLTVSPQIASLLLLPVCWLCTAEEKRDAAMKLPRLFETLADSQGEANDLAHRWIASVDAVGQCSWEEKDQVWLTESLESPRDISSKGSVEISRAIARLIRG